MFQWERSGSDWQFARRVLIVILLVAFACFLWLIARVLLLAFAAALIAVLLRALADLIARHTGVPVRWSLWLALAIIAGLLAGFVVLFGTQFSGQIRGVAERLPEAINQIGTYFGISNAAGLVQDTVKSSMSGNLVSRFAGLGYSIIGALCRSGSGFCCRRLSSC